MDSFLHPSFSDWAGHGPEAPRPPAVTPHFAYTETFEGGAVYRGISAGRGKFISVEEVPRAVAFAVAKDRSQETVAIDIMSDPLRRTISNALGVYFGAASPQSPDLGTLLNNYSALKRHLETLRSLLPDYPETLEFGLLVEDLLPDRAVFDGLGMERPGGQYVLSQAQRRDLHERSIDTGLDVLDDTFRLGIMPLDVTEDTLRALSTRYVQKTLPDGFAAPREPSVPETLPETPAPRYDPVFPSGVEAEQPSSYKSFSNLALRIKKGRQTGGPGALDTPASLADHVDHFPKVGSPLRSDTLKGVNGYATDDLLGVNNGILTPLSALESSNVAVGVGGTAPIHRRTDVFHTGMGMGMGSVPPAMSAPLDSGLCEYFTSRSEGTPETDFDPLFLGARDALLPAASLPTTATTCIPGINGSLLDMGSTKGRSAHVLRQQLGRDLIASLTGLCRSVRDAVGRAEAGSPASSVSAHFASFIRVWSAGIGAFRRVTNNHPPRGLLEVLDCLVVASAMCAAADRCSGQDGGSMYFEFVNDLGRWRSLLAPDEHPLFDKIALSLWLSVGLSDPTPERAEKDGLSRFQELMQDLVIPEPHPRAAVHPAPYATPLGAIQREHASKEEQAGAPASGAVSIPIPSGGARKRVYDEALDADGDGDGDGFSISDVFDVERFLARSVGDESEGGGAPDLAWNDILSTTALILASTAFSVFLTLTTVIHRDFNADSTLSIWRRQAGYKRSCAVLEDFIDSVGGKRGGARGAPHVARSLDQGIRRLSLSTMSAPSAESRAHRERMRARASVTFIPPQTSHSLGSHPQQPPRLRCQYAGCAKTFSSVSNRNKHMREGCQRGGGGGAGERRAGYRCRREGCTRVLTTKWYRNTHEAERCRFRGPGKGHGNGQGGG